MKKKFMLVLIVGLVLVFCISTGCSSSSKDKGALKAALVTSGVVSDGGWNEKAFDGLNSLKALGYETKYTDNVSQDNQASTLQGYCDAGYDLIICHGYEWGASAKSAAKNYPGIHFLQVGGSFAYEGTANFASVEYASYQLGFMAGVIGGTATKTNKFGFEGAEKIPTLTAEVDAIKGGAKSVNPNTKVTDVYTGSWTDVVAGKTASKNLVDAGNDVIIGIGDACDVGVVQYLAESTDGKVWFIGWTGDFRDKYGKDPKYNFILTSMIQDVNKTITRYGTDLKNGKWQGGAKVAGVKDGDLYIGKWSPKAPVQVIKAGTDVQNKIKDGSLTKKDIAKACSIPKEKYYLQVGEEGFLPQK